MTITRKTTTKAHKQRVTRIRVARHRKKQLSENANKYKEAARNYLRASRKKNHHALKLTRKQTTTKWGAKLKYISSKRKILITPDEMNCIIVGLKQPMYIVSITTGTNTLYLHNGPSKMEYEKAKKVMKNNNEMTIVFSCLREYVQLQGDDVESIDNRFTKIEKNTMVFVGKNKTSIHYIQKIEKYKNKKCLFHVSQDGYLQMGKTCEADHVTFVDDFGRKSAEIKPIVKSTRKNQKPDYYIAESSKKYKCAYWNRLWGKDQFWKEMKNWKESLDVARYEKMKVVSIPNHIALKMVEKRHKGKDWWEMFLELAIVDEFQDLSFLFIRDVLVGHNLWIFNIYNN